MFEKGAYNSMMTLHLNNPDGRNYTNLLTRQYIQPDALESKVIRDALLDVEGVYKIEGLAMYSKEFGVKSPESLSNGIRTLILCNIYDKHKALLNVTNMGANVAPYLAALSKEADFHINVNGFLAIPFDAEMDAVDFQSGTRMYNGHDYSLFYGGKEGVPDAPSY